MQRLNFIDVATGSLGQGLGCAAGMAYTGKYFDKSEYVSPISVFTKKKYFIQCFLLNVNVYKEKH